MSSYDMEAATRIRELEAEVERLRGLLNDALVRVQEHVQSMPAIERADLERLLKDALETKS
jgi:hypothetical protein